MPQARVLRHAARLGHTPSAARQYSQLRNPNSSSKRVQITPSPALNRIRPHHATFLASSAIAGVRHQSTQTSQKSPVFEQVANSPSQPSDNATDLFEQLSQTASTIASRIDPHIGMLKENGLDFGWGPSSIAEWIVEHLHIWGGLPWWGALASTALLYRTSFLYPMIRSSHMGAIAAAIAPAQREIRRRYKESDMSKEEAMNGQTQEIKYLMRKTGYSVLPHFGPIVLQGVFSFGLFRFSRSLAQSSGFGLENESLLWLTNLTVADPFYILPAVAALTMFVQARDNMRRAKENGSAMISDDHWMSYMLKYGLPGITFAVLSQLPAGVQIPMLVLSTTTTATHQALYSKSIRDRLGIAQYPTTGRQAVDVRGRRQEDSAAGAAGAKAPASDPLQEMMEQFGLAQNNDKETKLEKNRGKEQVRRASEYDKRRKARLAEQSMRDNI